ncbi:hypothetical protein [Nostoc sphaeroides]|uniref:DNA-damage-inducible protein D n=1 Tax=Nostoc sphaeroides CCNUC1 TaxID=2653204 RepID=A0A5P8WI15_9NOSO|nr:hypothetical protein [Nostoc sphaeroides]QFS52438.1 DNA-damage-inducible protein D [Nostoc sphaeroides CCNUC1]
MSNLLNFNGSSNSSLFDGIRHVADQGEEYWLARELMALLSYKKWERFVDAIDRAKIGCKTLQSKYRATFSMLDFLPVTKVFGSKMRTGCKFYARRLL